jgi:pimeloyl-ACP methyl ester carboxylesterase
MPAEPADDPRWCGRPLAEARWQLELARLIADPVWRGEGVPHGDGRPVLLLPGFLAGDYTLTLLARWLRRIGYRPSTCGFLFNVDCSDRALDLVEHEVARLHRRRGRRVALVGHSRGGHFARALARRRPGQVSHAISMGADLQRMLGISAPTRVAVDGARRGIVALRRARAEQCLTMECTCPFTRDFSASFPRHRVRLTSIYTKADGVVRWERCLVPYADCVEVTGSHTGLVVNRKAYAAIAAALTAPELGGEP